MWKQAYAICICKNIASRNTVSKSHLYNTCVCVSKIYLNHKNRCLNVLKSHCLIPWIQTRYALFSRPAVVHFNFRAGSTFPVLVCTVPHVHWVNKADNQQDYSQCNKVDAVRLNASYRLNLLLLKGQRCMIDVLDFLFWIFMTETILRTGEGLPGLKYIFNKMWN